MAKSDAEPEAPSEPPPTEVEITVAGHTVRISAARSLEDVAAQALGLFEQTRGVAKRIPVGFDVGGGQFELTEQPDHVRRAVDPYGPEEE